MQIWQYAAVAVVVLAVAISGTFFYAKNMYSEVAMIEKFTPAGGMITIELPDGSKVQTNSEPYYFIRKLSKEILARYIW